MFTEARKHLADAMSGVMEFFFPHAAETDQSFQQEIRKLSRRALYIIASVEIGMPLLGQLAGLLTHRTTVRAVEQFLLLGFLLLGTCALAAARTKLGNLHARPVAWISAFVSAALLISAEYLSTPSVREAAYLSYSDMMVVMVVALAAVPFRPLHIFSLGCSIIGLSLGFAQLAMLRNLTSGDPIRAELLSAGGIFTLLCTALAAVNYQRLHASHLSHGEAMRAERRLLLSENTATIGRLAAAFSHEMNTPLGVLKSSTSTMWAAASKYASATDEQRGTLLALIQSLGKAVNQSANRLSEIVGRIERITNLDRAEVQSVDLNELLRDVVSLAVPSGQDRVHLDLALRPLPPLTCRPQELSAVFINLVGDAVESAGADGQILVSTSRGTGQVEVLVRYTGRAVPAGELTSFFDPRFQASGGRVATGNWHLFSARQTIREHGGEISVTSGEERGTEITIVLPCPTG